ncbi:MAG: hypothetical protein HJJLKODD_00056 [Phycisphaerae bacterium]|nr:hypothetical protein [Phycisphaerae bacterium]
MSLPVIDPEVRFACGTCTACCDQPWRTLIELDKIPAIEQHDFSAYPQLRDKEYFTPATDHPERYAVLAKGEGTRCLFLDRDGLCIIHKELGAAAKPHMCRQFPYLPVRWNDQWQVSANYGCPSVQERRGPELTSQAEDISRLLPVLSSAAPATSVPLGASIRVSIPVVAALQERILQLWSNDSADSIWTIFAQWLALLLNVGRFSQQQPDSEAELFEKLTQETTWLDYSSFGEMRPYTRQMEIAFPVRMLFAANLYSDTVPAEALASISFWQRLTMVPRLMSLARLQGAYASHMLNQLIQVERVWRDPTELNLSPAAVSLYKRYFRSRIRQGYGLGRGLSLAAALHQHILDYNALHFFARVLAQSAERPDDDHIWRRALTLVEFHLANQHRLYEKTMKKWFYGQLNNIFNIWGSLRMFSPAGKTVSV